MERRLAAILAADVVGYSRLMAEDEETTLAGLKAHRADLFDPAIATHNGRIIKLMGDGTLVEFASVVDAVNCAVAVQSALAEDNGKIRLRIGINLGDVIVEGDDIYGDGVNVAARLEGIAETGGIALSDDAYRQVRDRIEAAWQDAGEHQLKNIARPVRVWRWLPQESPAPRPVLSTDGPLPLPDKPSIVVLPFNNMSGDAEQDFFADGITEDITTELARFGELFVIARNTAFTYKGETADVTSIAHELGVHFVLEGSVRRAGNRVRINAQLIDGQSGNHLWADRYDGTIEEVFDLQDQVTQQVVSATMPNIEEAAFNRIKRGDVIFDSTHELGWQASDRVWEAFHLGSETKMQAAKAMAYKAIELNERCFRAYYAICIALWAELLLQWTDDLEQGRKELQQVAARYVNLAPTSHTAYYCRGMANMMSGRTAAGLQDLRHSADLNPNDSSVLSLLAYAEVQRNNLARAKDVAARAIRINPKDFMTGTAYLALAHAAFVEGDDEFRHYAEKAILVEPEAPMRRVLMIAHAAEVGDERLLEEHLAYINRFAPRFIPRFLNDEIVVFTVPEHRARIVAALRKAGLPR